MVDQVLDEMALVKLLKDGCDSKGRELNPKKSAEILHKLGLVYMNPSDEKPLQTSLIRSAVLLNAAIYRNPATVDNVKADLTSLCSRILQLARAENRDGNIMIEITNQTVGEIEEMRNEILPLIAKLFIVSEYVSESELHKSEVEKIKEIKKLQKQVYESYRKIMRNLSKNCIKIKGKPPCKFALVGLGSFARGEITPYSDFEHVIVLEDGVKDQSDYADVLAYYRWLSTIYLVILVNLKETIVRFAAIPHLNDCTKAGGDWFYDTETPCGISPDGLAPHACINPIGRQEPTMAKPFTVELIQPVSRMAKFLDSDEEHGYHLSEVLTQCTFVAGDEEVFNEFSKEVQKKLRDKNPTLLMRLANHFSKPTYDKNAQIEKDPHVTDLQYFDTLQQLKSNHTGASLNVKKVLYRSVTLFITLLGRFHNVRSTSCFDILDDLMQSNYITSDDHHKLNYSVAIACEVRLKVYTNMKMQDDWVESVSEEEHELIKLVGAKSAADFFKTVCYFRAAIIDHVIRGKDFHLRNYDVIDFSVQRFLKEVPNPSTLPGFIKGFLKTVACSLLVGEGQTIFQLLSGAKHDREQPQETKQLKNYWFSPTPGSRHALPMSIEPESINFLWAVVVSLSHAGIMRIEHDDQSTDESLHMMPNASMDPLHMDNLWALSALTLSSAFELDGSDSQKTTQIIDGLKSKLELATNDEEKCMSLCKIGSYLMMSERFLEAVNYFWQIRNLTISDECRKHPLHKALLPLFYRRFNDFDQGYLPFMMISILFDLDQLETVEDITGFPMELDNANKCYLREDYQAAIFLFNKALQRIVLCRNNLDSLRTTCCIHGFGRCLTRKRLYDDAIAAFQQELMCLKLLSDQIFLDSSIGDCLSCIGDCYVEKFMFEEALEKYRESLQVERRMLKLNKSTEEIEADCYCKVASHLVHLNDQVELFQIVQRMFEYCPSQIDGWSKQHKVDILSCNIYMRCSGQCVIWQYVNAYSSFLNNVLCGPYVSNCYFRVNVSDAMVKNYKGALMNFKKELTIRQNTCKNESGDGATAICLHHISSCLMKLKMFDEAMPALQRGLVIMQNVVDSTQSTFQSEIMRRYMAINKFWMGDCYFEQSDFQKSLAFYKASLTAERRLFHEDTDPPKIAAHCYFEIGERLLKRKRFSEAMLQFQSVLRSLSTFSKSSSICSKMSVCKLRIGLCLLGMDEADAAQKEFQRALHNLRSDKGCILHMADSIHHIVDMYIDAKAFTKALRQLYIELDLRKKVPDDEQYIIGVTECYFNIATCYEKLERFDDALAIHHNDLLPYLEKTLKSTNSCKLVAESKYHIAICYYKQSRYNEAHQSFNESWDIERRIANLKLKPHEIEAECLYDIGMHFQSTNDYELILRCFEGSYKAAKYFSDKPKMWNRMTYCSSQISDCLRMLNRPSEALKHAQRAMHRFSINDDTLLHVADCAESIGASLLSLERYDEAIKQYELKLEISEDSGLGNKAEENVIACKFNIALCLSKSQRYQEALERWKEIAPLLQEASTPQAKSMFATCSACMIRCKDEISGGNDTQAYAEAVNLFKQQLQRLIENQPFNDKDIAACECQIGLHLALMGECQEALHYLTKSLPVLEEANPRAYEVCKDAIDVCKTHITDATLEES